LRFLAGCVRVGLAVVLACAGVAAVWAQEPADLTGELNPPGAASTAPNPPAELRLNHRRILTMRATLLGDTPEDRARLAHVALTAALQAGGPGVVTRTSLLQSVRFELDGNTLFYLVPQDIARPRPEGLLEAAARDVEAQLRKAVSEHREISDPARLLKGAGVALAATVVMLVLVRLVFVARRKGLARLDAALRGRSSANGGNTGQVLSSYVEQAGSALRALLTGFTWLLVLLVLDGWATYVLHQFAYTRPWGERSTAWLLDVLQQFALAIAGAVPGLLVAALIFAIARLVSRATQALLQRVERGDAQLSWLDADTAVPTRRLAALGIWLFALAMAYPYLPGANSEAFKGVTVLAGLMLSLGASSVVGQALSGLSLMYSRSIRVGEYVKVGDTEGTVVALGMFTTKVHTGMGEEVSLPNTVIFSQPIRNFSRLVQDGHFMLHTSVTIGYATPWRQVHAMLLEAAQRTPGVAEQPAPYVVQTALSDFYIEYRLCAQSNKNAPSRRVEAMNQLHANVLDVFNENGVQIMSPHYMADPPEPQVVPPERWSPPPARTPTP
jgi:small-conductance mechanosensitive channel